MGNDNKNLPGWALPAALGITVLVIVAGVTIGESPYEKVAGLALGAAVLAALGALLRLIGHHEEAPKTKDWLGKALGFGAALSAVGSALIGLIAASQGVSLG